MLPAHLATWLDLAVRWLHVTAGVTWIGTSFYFNWLNHRIRPPEEPLDGVAGELWSVHGGGFYRVLKYAVAPEKLPGTLHWFKWEAYTTWLSGAALLSIVYYLGPDSILVDPAAGLSKRATIGIGVLTLVVGWFVYDALARRFGGRPGVLVAIGVVGVAALAWGLSQVMSDRAAYLHVGALIGTIMAANVFFVIIPGQRKMVEAMAAGRTPDPAPGLAGAQRSLHNNYLTLPVLFIMVSNHFPTTYGHPWNWAILTALSVIGAGVRHWFNLRGQGHRNVWILPAAALGMVALALVTRPAPAATADGEVVEMSTVVAIVEQRCLPCHSATPTQPGFAAPPKGIAFDDPAVLADLAPRIRAVAVDTDYMPLGNVTGMTDEEREILGRWIAQLER